MLVDVSHVSVTTMRHAVETSTAPVIASHSGADAVAPHPRNIPDDVLVAIAATGGIVMVPFYPPFVVPATARLATEVLEEGRRLMAELGDEHAVDAVLAERRIGWDRGGVGDVVDHIEHIARIAGVDHVGLGSDFDGIDLVISGLEDVSCFPAVTVELVRRGWEEGEIRRVLGGNAMRVLAATDV
jgi:membrane dipeptidase